MLDLASETVLSLHDAAAAVPSARQGKPVSPSTILRWITTVHQPGSLGTVHWATDCGQPDAGRARCAAPGEAAPGGRASLVATGSNRHLAATPRPRGAAAG